MTMPNSEEMQQFVRERSRFLEIERAGDRRRVVVIASRMIDTLEDKDPNRLTASRLTDTIEPKVSSAPEEVPHFHWKASLGDGFVGKVGSFGTLLVEQWHNERPADLVNAGFYAGVLAAKAGLVDMETFHRDTEAPAEQ